MSKSKERLELFMMSCQVREGWVGAGGGSPALLGWDQKRRCRNVSQRSLRVMDSRLFMKNIMLYGHQGRQHSGNTIQGGIRRILDRVGIQILMSTGTSQNTPAKTIEQSATENQFSEVQQPQPSTNPSAVPAAPASKINKNFWQRTRTTIYMLVGFVFVLSMGHFYVSLLILLLIIAMFRQVCSIKRRYQKQNSIPFTPLLSWYVLLISGYYFLGKLLLVKLPSQVLAHPTVSSLLQYHNFITFLLWISAFLLFVMTLQKGYMRYQFNLFGWTNLAVLLIAVPGGGMLFNLYEGLCWFILPTLLIICNDIFAYLVGYFFGKTRLIALSPKKTWEGYLGGAVITFFGSQLLVFVINQLPTLVCPQTHFTLDPREHPVCDSYLLSYIPVDIGIFSFEIQRLQVHTFVLSAFASIVGPFGGFFASGLKRSIKIKDWADTIPGHGGITDRMDCQLLMGLFTFFYVHNIALESRATYSHFLNNFSTLQQLTLYNEIKRVLVQHSI